MGLARSDNSASLWKFWRRRFGRPDRHEHDEHDDADQRHQDQVTDGSAAHRELPKLNARSIDDPADPAKLPLRPKNNVMPSPLLTADCTFASRRAARLARMRLWFLR